MFDEYGVHQQYVEVSQASAPFDNAQDNRHMRAFSINRISWQAAEKSPNVRRARMGERRRTLFVRRASSSQRNAAVGPFQQPAREEEP